MKADIKTDKKTHMRTEDAAADRAMNGDSSSARVDDGWTSLTSFGMKGANAIIRRRWLNACRHSLYINEGHLSLTASFIGPNQPIRLVSAESVI